MLPREYEGKVQKVFFQNDSHAVFSFRISKTEVIKCAGDIILQQGEGEQFLLRGDWYEHEKYGTQFKIETWEKPVPIGKEAVIEYLSSGVIKGIGKKMAERIVHILGEVAIDRILNEGPDALVGVPKIGQKKAKDIYQHLKDNMAIQKLMTKLMAYELSPNIAMKVYKRFGDTCIQVLQENPYKLMDISLVGFATADRLAQKIGFAPDSQFRLQAGLVHTLNETIKKYGHTYMLRHEWLEATCNLFQDVPIQVLDQMADILEDNKQVAVDRVKGEIRVCPRNLAYAENLVAKWVARRLIMKPQQAPGIERLIAAYEKEHSIILAQMQREAVKMALVSPLFVLTGGPGTGKTTVTRAILWCYAKLHPAVLHDESQRVILCAPTGRAARRMQEVTGQDSQTIHRLLGYKGKNMKEHDRNNQLKCKLLVSDESSMIDIQLASDTVGAIPDSAQVIFVGDTDQLPSVGPGAFLYNMIEAGVPSVRLDVVHRQAQQSNIVVSAHRILRNQSIQTGNDLFFVQKDDNTAIKERLVAGVKKLLANGWTSDDIQVLTSMKKTELGTIALNTVLQRTINPPSLDKPEAKHGNKFFRVGDKVMQTMNNYKLEVFNGEIGKIVGIELKDEEEILHVQFPDGLKVYEKELWGQLEHAYAITTHKSQGGEYPVVLIPMSTSHYVMLYRNLIYTGITRAKKLCGIIGMPKALDIACSNIAPVTRNTGLTDRIVMLLDHSLITQGGGVSAIGGPRI